MLLGARAGARLLVAFGRLSGNFGFEMTCQASLITWHWHASVTLFFWSLEIKISQDFLFPYLVGAPTSLHINGLDLSHILHGKR